MKSPDRRSQFPPGSRFRLASSLRPSAAGTVIHHTDISWARLAVRYDGAESVCVLADSVAILPLTKIEVRT